MRFAVLLTIFLACHYLQAQDTDTAKNLQAMSVVEVRFNTYYSSKATAVISRAELDRQYPYSLVPALNSIPGVRMEERSPGSYRLSVRGSLLRSPFGIRNVKVYLGVFPFTDASGNTYLNSLDMSGFEDVKVIKGPASSQFGANTGGALIIAPVRSVNDSSRLIAGLSAGSYGLLAEHIHFRKRFKKSILTINQAYQQSNGYRRNSAMERQYLQLNHEWNYAPKAWLEVMALFSNLYYQTPGGLTLQQYESDPQSARPATATLPGAETQKASVRNTTYFAGIKHTYVIAENFRHVLALFSSGTDFSNPFITNFEKRREYTLGVRSFISRLKKNINFTLGIEAQQTHSDIDNFGNRAGVRDTLQASDKLRARQGFIFSNLTFHLRDLSLEAGISYNLFGYAYEHRHPLPIASGNKSFNPQLMPHIGFSYTFNKKYNWRASLSTGYSTPTIAEVRASDNRINTNLQAEQALNLETGLKCIDLWSLLSLDVSVFHYKLRNAIVRRTDTAGNEYFINAGGTVQDGLEAQLTLALLKGRSDGMIRTLTLTGNIAWYQFRFRDYMVNNNNYSGNPLTGVPSYTSTESMYIGLPANTSLFAQYSYVSGMTLNDAGTEKAKAYHLLQLKAQWVHRFRKVEMTLFAGVDNLLDQTYSLGNDLNAAGARYYNAAAPRNYYGGVNLKL